MRVGMRCCGQNDRLSVQSIDHMKIETERLFLREMNEDYYVALYRLAGGRAHAAGYGKVKEWYMN